LISCFLLQKRVRKVLKIISGNPAADVEHPVTLIKQNPLPKYLEKEELMLFLATVRDYGKEGDYELFSLLAYTGLRISEALALTPAQIDFATDEVTVNRNLYSPPKKDGVYIVSTPKNQMSCRVIDVDHQVLKLIRALIHRNRTLKLRRRNCWHSDEDFLFIQRETEYAGKPLHRLAVNARMKSYLKRAGIAKKLSSHSLRHTHCSLLAEAGASIDEIQARLGHARGSNVTALYLHVTRSRRKDAAKKFSVLMKSLSLC
jgi:integrase